MDLDLSHLTWSLFKIADLDLTWLDAKPFGLWLDLDLRIAGPDMGRSRLRLHETGFFRVKATIFGLFVKFHDFSRSGEIFFFSGFPWFFKPLGTLSDIAIWSRLFTLVWQKCGGQKESWPKLIEKDLKVVNMNLDSASIHAQYNPMATPMPNGNPWPTTSCL